MAVNRYIPEKVAIARELGIDVREDATYGNWFRRLPADTAQRINSTLQERSGGTYKVNNPQGLSGVKTSRPIEKPAEVELDGGTYLEVKTAAALRNAFVSYGDRQVSLRISFDDQDVYVSDKTASVDAGGKGEGKGESGRIKGHTMDEPVRFYVGDPNGFAASEIVALIDYYANALDAMYVLWLLVVSGGSM